MPQPVENQGTRPAAQYERTQASQISGNLYRGEGGEFQGGPGTILKKRLEAIRAARKKAKAKGGKGKAAKPKVDKAAEAAAERAKNRAAVFEKLAVPEAAAAQLAALEAGDIPEDARGLLALGLAELDSAGEPRLTKEARALLKAADDGDAGRAREAISRAGDALAAAEEKEQADADKEAAPEEEKPKGGGGGGGKKKPTDAEKQAEKRQERRATAEATAEDVGFDDLDDLTEAADAGGVASQALQNLGLIDADGNATDQGRRALTALERGNEREYRAALLDAKRRLERDQERQNTQSDRARARAEREAERERRQREREMRRRTPGAIKMDYTAILDAIERAGDSLATDDATKAGARHSATDTALLNQICAAACDIKELAISLGADDPDEEEDEEYEGGDVEMMEGKADEPTFYIGSEVKAIGDDGVRALAVRFGSEDESDMSHARDYFTKATDYWLDAWDRRPMLYHHALDEATQDAPRIGTWTKATVTDEGVWLEGQLDRAHRYYGAIKELIKRGVLRVSSDSAPHLVLREARANGTHEVKRWPLLAASLTPTPAEPRLSAVSFKALLAELGLEGIDDSPEAGDPPTQSADGQKAVEAERARRLSEELEHLSILEALWTL